MLISVIISILFFGLIIFIHELGHFIFAKLFGVETTEFSIGMGPKILSKSSEDGTVYSLRLLPIGGYVAMSGEDEESDSPYAFCNQSAPKKLCILAAGAFMNLVLGFLLTLLFISFTENLFSNKIESFNIIAPDGQIVTEYQGLLPGDEIIKINNDRIYARYDYVFAAMRNGTEKSTLTLRRNGETVTIRDFQFPTVKSGTSEFGNPNFFVPAVREKTVFNVLKETFCQTTTSVKMVYYSLYDIITGKHSVSEISGPVGVVKEISASASEGVLSTLFLLAMITINIGVFNLLPFPALDGGRIIIVIIEAVTNRKFNKKIEGYINAAGLFILFALMIAVTLKDISVLF